MGSLVTIGFGAGVGVALVIGFWLLADFVSEMNKYAQRRGR
jgi:hypothetical protein